MAEALPANIRLDASTACQLRCPSCPTTAGLTQRYLGTGMMALEDFERLLDANPHLHEIELSNYGEALLNPKLPEMLALAQARGVRMTLVNGVNLNTASEKLLEALVRYQVRGITVSIDGASPESYARYRVRGDFETVIRNITRINHYKQQYASKLPVLYWQFVVFGHNEHEMDTAISLAAQLDMKLYFKMSWDDEISPLRDPELVKAKARWPATTRAHFRETHGRDVMRGICHQLWNAPQVNWDGRLLGCCRNFWGDFGANVFEVGLAEALASEPMRYAKQMLQGQAPPRDDIPCTSCELYKTLASRQDWIRPEELLT